MHVILAEGVNDAYRQGLEWLNAHGQHLPTRNGEALVSPRPVTTHYAHPARRVLFAPKRDANPFFHLFEALWMLDGRQDVEYLAQFVPRIANYSDDGERFHGAYGFRWRNHWAMDQLDVAVRMLRNDPSNRRVVISMWDPDVDLDATSRDIPCNDMIKLSIDAGRRLNMVVFNRSNDAIWGCYGANVVHFSMLQEYLAARIGVLMGWYEQVSCDFHAYASEWDKRWPLDVGDLNPYRLARVGVHALVDDPESFDQELHHFLRYPDADETYRNTFLSVVAQPMWEAHRLRRTGSTTMAREHLLSSDVDWHVAACQWLARRMVNV